MTNPEHTCIRYRQFILLLPALVHRAKASSQANTKSNFQSQTKRKSKLPQWNTGRLYMATASQWHTGSYGIVCKGNREFVINKIFGKLVCRDNGFNKLDFIGLRKQYLHFIKGIFCLS